VLLMSGYTDDALAHHGVLDEELFFWKNHFHRQNSHEKFEKFSMRKNLCCLKSNGQNFGVAFMSQI